MTILRRVKKTIAENDLICRGDSILIALSGGPDSVALLRVLVELRGSMGLSLSALYVNHQIRPRAARKEERFCEQLCDVYVIDLTLVCEDIPALANSEKRGIEETARDFRYGVLEQVADEDGHDRIALGHHADDRVEAILFRLFRGTGRSGMIGMPVSRGRIVRPLYDLTKSDILSYLREVNQDYCEDRSNRSIEYSRNFIRNKLLPQIRGKLNVRADAALLSYSEMVVSEEQFLEKLVTKAVRRCVKISPGGKLALDLAAFDSYDIWLRRRLLRRCFKALSLRSLPPDREVIDRIDQFSRKGGKALSLPQAVRAARVGESLVLYRPGGMAFDEVLVPGKSLRLDRPRVRFRCHLADRSASQVHRGKRSRTVTLDWNKLAPPVSVRSIRSGDRFRPLGLKGSKKVSDYLIDRKVPRVYRDEIPVVCDQKGIVWLVGYEIAERVRVDTLTRKVLRIEFDIRRKSTAETV